jgi:hypothetical protein
LLNHTNPAPRNKIIPRLLNIKSLILASLGVTICIASDRKLAPRVRTSMTSRRARRREGYDPWRMHLAKGDDNGQTVWDFDRGAEMMKQLKQKK